MEENSTQVNGNKYVKCYYCYKNVGRLEIKSHISVIHGSNKPSIFFGIEPNLNQNPDPSPDSNLNPNPNMKQADTNKSVKKLIPAAKENTNTNVRTETKMQENIEKVKCYFCKQEIEKCQIKTHIVTIHGPNKPNIFLPIGEKSSKQGNKVKIKTLTKNRNSKKLL